MKITKQDLGDKIITTEIWKPVVDYEDHYEVSNLGRFKRIKGIQGTSPGRILKPWKTKTGYLSVTLTKDSIRKSFKAHRLVALTFLTKDILRNDVNHIDNNRHNNILSNLEWCTRKENMEHAVKQNRMNRGDNHHLAKLKQEDILHIRSSKLTLKELGDLYNVTGSHISRIKLNKAWNVIN